MAAPAVQDLSQTIGQLNKARILGLGDANYYSKIVPGILPIVGPQSPLELRRWGADFLAETFASPMLPSEDKQALALQALPLLKQYLDSPGQDFAVIRSVIQAAASIYPFIFRYTIATTDSGQWHYWNSMMEIKSNILRRMDDVIPGLRICCIKFVQQVVLTQTPGIITDPRRSEQNEISLALAPREHPLISPSKLEAEASGLLDRILGILQENVTDALLITATLNSLGGLIRARATIANKIITAILNFNPFKLANEPLTPLNKVHTRSMERTTRSFLTNILKKNPHHPQAARIQGYLERMAQIRLNVFDESASRKRPLPAQAPEPPMQAKRPRIDGEVPPAPQQPSTPAPLPPGPVSYAQLFTLSTEPGTMAFDVKTIPHDLVSRIVVPILQSIDATTLQEATNAVRTRLLALQAQQQAEAAKQAALAEDDDDYEPEIPGNETSEQAKNRVEMDNAEDFAVHQVALGPYKLDTPPLLSQTAIARLNERALIHFFTNVSAFPAPGTKAPASARQAASTAQNRIANMAFIERAGLRLPLGLGSRSRRVSKGLSKLTDRFRERVLQFILQDWRRRIDLAISWLTEEWETDREVEKMQRERRGGSRAVNGGAAKTDANGQKKQHSTPNYQRWALKFLDELSAFIGSDGSETKILIRFLSEIPSVDAEVLAKVKQYALDPERVSLAVTALRFLLMFRPAVRELVLDALEDMYRNYDGAQKLTLKDLTKWRPKVLQQAQESDGVRPDGSRMDGAVGEIKVET